MSERAETNKERIEQIQRRLPPKPGVNSRTGYASLDYLAELLGTNRQHVISWMKGVEPSEKHRERLAALSEGQYQPDDFRLRPPAGAAGVPDLPTLFGILQSLQATVEEHKEQIAALEARVDAIAPASPPAPARTGPTGHASR